MSTLYVDNLQPNLGSRVMAAGHVINQEMATVSTQVNITSSTLTSVWTPSYTPISDNSDVYALFNLNIMSNNNGGNDARYKWRIELGGVTLFSGIDYGPYDYNGGGTWFRGYTTYFTKHTNSATSALNYNILLANDVDSDNARFCDDGDESQVIFTEIAR